jgi:hypothetical protein
MVIAKETAVAPSGVLEISDRSLALLRVPRLPLETQLEPHLELSELSLEPFPPLVERRTRLAAPPGL